MKKQKRSERPDIPVEDLPEGIQLAFQNCQRLYDDAISLNEQERYHTAIVQLILAEEEFAKCLLLFHHYKQKQKVSKNKVEEYFGSHRIRLEEFHQFFHESLPSSTLEEKRKSLIRGFWIFDQITKEKHTYVDWTQLGWSSPFTAQHTPFKSNRKDFEKFTVTSLKINLEHAIGSLLKNQDFVLTLKIPHRDRPDGDKIRSIIKNLVKGKTVPTRMEWGYFYIIVRLEKTDPIINEDLKKNLKKQLLNRYPNYLVFVFLEEKSST